MLPTMYVVAVCEHRCVREQPCAIFESSSTTTIIIHRAVNTQRFSEVTMLYQVRSAQAHCCCDAAGRFISRTTAVLAYRTSCQRYIRYVHISIRSMYENDMYGSVSSSKNPTAVVTLPSFPCTDSSTYIYTCFT